MSMNYRNAAGKNWGTPRAKRPAFKLGQARAPRRLPETLPPPGQLEHHDAAGRNWARERRKRSRSPKPGEHALAYPRREAGGGDCDCPYDFHPPSSGWTFPFTAWAFGRLLVLKGRVLDGDFADDLAPEPGP